MKPAVGTKTAMFVTQASLDIFYISGILNKSERYGNWRADHPEQLRHLNPVTPITVVRNFFHCTFSSTVEKSVLFELDVRYCPQEIGFLWHEGWVPRVRSCTDEFATKAFEVNGSAPISATAGQFPTPNFFNVMMTGPVSIGKKFPCRKHSSYG